MYKKVWCTSEVVVLLINQTDCFLDVLFAVGSLDLKVPYVTHSKGHELWSNQTVNNENLEDEVATTKNVTHC